MDNLQHCFNQNFYNDYYSSSIDLTQFIRDNVYEGRFIHECIIDDNFDYGLFISELNWDNIQINNEYEAIKYFLDNRDKYKHFFIDHHNDQYRQINQTNCFAIYIANIQSSISENIMIDSLECLSKNINNIYILLLGNKLNSSIYEKYKDKIISIDKIKQLKYLISKYKYCLYVNNNICLNHNLSRFMQKMPINAQLMTLIDIYHSYNGKRYRSINTDLMLMDTRVLIKILKQLVSKFNNNLNYYITKFLKDKKIAYHYYSQQTQAKETFWHNLLNNNLLDNKTLAEKYHLPAISSQPYTVLSRNLINCNINPQINTNTTVVSGINKYVINHTNKQAKIACHIHIGYTAPRYLNNIRNFMHKLRDWDIQYFMTSNRPIPEINTFILPNKGADIGPFLYVLNHFILKENYNLIIKIHTKNHHGFREICFDTICNNFAYIEFLLGIKNDCYIAGPNQKNMMLDNVNDSIINKFCNKYSIDIKHDKIDFFTGTMFVCKVDMFRNFIQKYGVDLLEAYLSLETGYNKNHQATYTHSWERILSGVIPFSLQSSKIYIS